MTDHVRRGMIAVLLLLFPACGGGSAPGNGGQPAPATMDGNEAAQTLEALAEDSGVLGEQAATDPMGSYGRTYDGGEDRLCILSSGQEAASYDFGVDIRIGDEEYCRGKGRAKQAGNLLILRFAGGRCTVTAHYEGDRIVMPGTVDEGCASLCSARGSLAGVNFPRVGLDALAARGVVGNDGEPLCRK